jgi:WD repeat-containing protein 48
MFFIFGLQDRLVANEFIQCRKVCEHVLEKVLGAEITPGTNNSNSSQNNSQSDANSEGSQIPPEDKIELLCNDVVSD